MAAPTCSRTLSRQLTRRITCSSRYRGSKTSPATYLYPTRRDTHTSSSILLSPCLSAHRQLAHKTQQLHLPQCVQRTYYTPLFPEDPPYNPMEEAILSAAYAHIPTHGFTHKALALGAQDAGYLAASTNLFPRGAFELVMYHLITRRLELKHNVQFPDLSEGRKPPGVTQKVKTLLLARLHANKPVHDRLPEALGLMSLAGNIPASLKELGLLVDEIWYLAGDVSVDSSWYSKRGLLAGVYASSELFMSQDKSVGFKETEAFLQRRLEDVGTVGKNASAVGEWLGFTGAASVNVLRSWGVRI